MSMVLEASASLFSLRQVKAARHINSLVEDVEQSLLTRPRSLPPKYFYDETGSHLFDQICQTPEYYPTRTEAALLQTHAKDIMQRAQVSQLLEFGSGTSVKTRHLLQAAENIAVYWPSDVCAEIMQHAAEHLLEDFPGLRIEALEADYHAGLQHWPQPEEACLYLFLGGTLGNFLPEEAQAFLQEVATRMKVEDSLLIGFDRIKGAQVLYAAYNDAQGVTAEFNLNVLNVLNRECGANFNLAQFQHEAVFNPELSRIEMYLESRSEQTVEFSEPKVSMQWQEGERVMTEISRKFSEQSLRSLLAQSGFRLEQLYNAPDEYYSLGLVKLA